MPRFRYSARNARGQEVKGTLHAVNRAAAATNLRGNALFVQELVLIAETAGGRARRNSVRRSLLGLLAVRSRDRIVYFQQMALMLRAGLTILQALEVCRAQSVRPRFADAIERISESVSAGSSLSDSMAAEKKIFPPGTVKMVETAEATGELDDAMDRLAVQLEQRQEVKNHLFTSLMYPGLVMFVSIGVVAYLVTQIIPKFARFLANRNVALPASTQFLMDLSAFLRADGLLLLAGGVAGLILLIVTYLTPKGRFALDQMFLWVPIIGKLLIAAAMANLGRTLSSLLSSGVGLLEGLKILASGIGNRAIARRVEHAAEGILNGRSLSEGLRGAAIPPLFTQTVVVGEQTGTLDHVLGEVGEFYDRDLQQRIRRMSALFEPVMILLIGGMVGFVYLAFFQAVFQLTK